MLTRERLHTLSRHRDGRKFNRTEEHCNAQTYFNRHTVSCLAWGHLSLCPAVRQQQLESRTLLFLRRERQNGRKAWQNPRKAFGAPSIPSNHARRWQCKRQTLRTTEGWHVHRNAVECGPNLSSPFQDRRRNPCQQGYELCWRAGQRCSWR